MMWRPVMNVSLTPELEKKIDERVATGNYTSASELVREALRLFFEIEESRRDEIAAQNPEANPDAALRFIDDIHETFAFLARHPHAGHARPDLTDRPVFFWPVRKTYAGIYRKAAPL